MKKSAAVECSEEFRALRNTMEHWKTVAADFAKQVEVKDRQLETACDDETSLLHELKATREARDDLAKRVVELRDLRYADEKQIARLNALENELKVLETAFDESQNHLGDALASAAKAAKEAYDISQAFKTQDAALREAERMAKRWENQWNVSNSERETNAIRIDELKREMEQRNRNQESTVRRLQDQVDDLIVSRNMSIARSEAYEKIALAAVGVKP